MSARCQDSSRFSLILTASIMLLVFAIAYTLHTSINTAPLQRANGLPIYNTNSSTSGIPNFGEAHQQCTCPSPQRSLSQISWSCLVTIFACSWVSMHPNIPAPREKRSRILLQRLRLMFWALICPELIIFWAMRQWSGARQIANQYRNEGWTKTHGHFIQMGGFTLYKGNESHGILSIEVMEDLLFKRTIEFPSISEDEIQDRSKSDSISKALAICQTTWFTSQCIARWIQGLDITQLELVTVALALLNAIIYYLWWNKPFDVRCSVPINLLDRPLINGARCKATVKPIDIDQSPGAILKGPFQIPSLLHRKTIALSALSKQAASAIWTIINDKTCPRKVVKAIIVLPIWLIMGIYETLNCMAGESEIFCGGHASVPMFYALNISGRDHLLFAVLVIGMVFGGIHCAGWNLHFPSHTESFLWRVSSVLITVIPGCMIFIIAGQKLGDNTPSLFIRKGCTVMVKTLGIPTFILLPVYVFARLFLLVQALVSLRDLKPNAFDAVDWTIYVPHI